jgi:hypothetical protein
VLWGQHILFMKFNLIHLQTPTGWHDYRKPTKANHKPRRGGISCRHHNYFTPSGLRLLLMALAIIMASLRDYWFYLSVNICITSIKESLNQWIPIMLRQAQHERNPLVTVRDELVEGFVQRFPYQSNPTNAQGYCLY